ncbi:cation transporter [Hahella sp. CCB-MM4]|uniref:cation diffusion facilitator family transporter n=1 Tax=Hahella sp. (strain CCB-MM4) TaxID=1926491 RepID=UPI000B9C278A|nr:cation diffusion facilitator family transporter [Hahella sp. CCB-MM4]OZG71626.1 cation transporter [Hahella sp. CCB-MM4]
MSSHHHHHSHVDDDASSGRIALAFWLNATFALIEFVGGWLTNSTAIMADAVHDLGDALAIAFAWIMQKLSGRQADSRFSYGYRRFSLLAALVNGGILIIGSVWVLSMAIPRLMAPEMPHAQGMFWLAILGVAVNGFAALKVSKGKTLNEQLLNWHLLEDVLGWLAVLIISVVLLFADWPILDPLLSIVFTLFILSNVVRHVIKTLFLFLQAVPDRKLRQEIMDKLLEIEHIRAIHHLHLWSLDGEKHVLTAHLELDKPISTEVQTAIKGDIADTLSGYALAHTTFEFEQISENCRDIEHHH